MVFPSFVPRSFLLLFLFWVTRHDHHRSRCTSATLFNELRPFVDRVELEDLNPETLRVWNLAKDCHEKENRVRTALTLSPTPTTSEDGSSSSSSSSSPTSSSPSSPSSSPTSSFSSSSTSSKSTLWLHELVAQNWRRFPDQRSPLQVLTCYVQVANVIEAWPRTTLAQSRIYFAVKTYAWEFFNHFYEWVYDLHREGIELLQRRFMGYANALKQKLTLLRSAPTNARGLVNAGNRNNLNDHKVLQHPHHHRVDMLSYEQDLADLEKILSEHMILCTSGLEYETALFTRPIFTLFFQRNVETHHLQSDFDATSRLCRIQSLQNEYRRLQTWIFHGSRDLLGQQEDKARVGWLKV